MQKLKVSHIAWAFLTGSIAAWPAVAQSPLPNRFSIHLVEAAAPDCSSAPKADDIKLKDGNAGAFWLAPEPVALNEISEAHIERHDDGDGFVSPTIRISLSKAGAEEFRNFTATHVGHELAYVLDDSIIGKAIIIAPITTGTAVISGVSPLGVRTLLERLRARIAS